MANTAVNIWVQIFCFDVCFHFCWDILREKLMYHMVMQYLTLGELPDCFPKCMPYFYNPTSKSGIPVSPHQYQNFCFLSFLVIATSVDMKRHLIVIFMSICVVVNNTGLFIVYLHWNNVCLNPLFKKDLFFLFKNNNLLIILCLKTAGSFIFLLLYCKSF